MFWAQWHGPPRLFGAVYGQLQKAYVPVGSVGAWKRHFYGMIRVLAFRGIGSQ